MLIACDHIHRNVACLWGVVISLAGGFTVNTGLGPLLVSHRSLIMIALLVIHGGNRPGDFDKLLGSPLRSAFFGICFFSTGFSTVFTTGQSFLILLLFDSVTTASNMVTLLPRTSFFGDDKVALEFGLFAGDSDTLEGGLSDLSIDSTEFAVVIMIG